MRIVINPQYERLRPFLEQLPQCFDREGVTIHDERNVIKQFCVDGIDVVVKRYRRPNIVQRVSYTFFRSSKAHRSFYNAGRLLAYGFSTPVNMAYVETYRGGLLDYCYYVSGVDAAPPIRHLLIEPDAFDRTMAADFARFAVALHQRGVLHGDLNSTNVLYHPQADGHYTFSVIDINRMRFYENGEPPLAECMENLTRFTGRMDLFEFVALEYVTCRQLPVATVGEMIAVKQRHDAAWMRRKQWVKRQKQLFTFRN